MSAATLSNSISASTSRLGRLMRVVEGLPEDLRTVFQASLIDGKPKAQVCRDGGIAGAEYDRRFSRLMRELKRQTPRAPVTSQAH
ncbi:MAG: hypothetical protein EPN79_11370 [Burkholderiaceae bacterium]|nr:MAG: hypothetical protein EPN79_11370 [Burkholderiaceae bacterium]TBR76716.1 MAG: hypothetical protein EPN64_05700 [Burkholderiaceae bacterium]